MHISYIGTGYIGQVNAAGAAYYGHDVILVDVIKEKIDSINAGKPTIFEKDLDDLLSDLVLNKKKLIATLDIEMAINQTQVSFICVGTPDKGGMIDLSYIQEVAKNIGKALKNKKEFHVVVVKSTVIPGTTLKIVKPLIEEFSGKKCGVDFGIAMNPEFLREGVALDDCIHPDSIVIGTQNEKVKDILLQVYDWASKNLFTFVGINAAEAIKYAKNSFLAMKITFANEWGNFCDKLGIDTKQVMDAIGKDKRISPMFLRNGPGYGGSCFPKDVNAIIHAGQVNQSPFRVLEQVVNVNNVQYLKLIQLAEKIIGPLTRKKVAVLGLSFKPNTDDTRDSPGLKIISYLTSIGCQITSYCPQGMKMAQKWFIENHMTDIIYADNAESCILNADCIFVPTDWDEFRPIIAKTTIPTFIGHRDLIEPDKYSHVHTLGYAK